MHLTFHASAFNTLATVLREGRAYSPEVKAERDRLYAAVRSNARASMGESVRGNALPIVTVTLSAEDGIALLDLLHATGLGWPHESADYDWFSTIVRVVVQGVAAAVRNGDRVLAAMNAEDANLIA